MKNHKRKYSAKPIRIVSPFITFVITAAISLYIVLNYKKIYEDKKYADMITCTEEISTQVYNAMMKTFSRVNILGELVSNRGLDILKDEKNLENIMSGTVAKGLLFAPNDKVEAVYPNDKMSCYMGLDFNTTFPETIRIEILKKTISPIILGPYNIPDSSEQAMAIVAPYYKSTYRGRELCGRVALVVDYPAIFRNVDFTLAEDKGILMNIWKNKEGTTERLTLLQTNDSFSENFWDDCETFPKLYFTTNIFYSLMGKYSFWQTREFVLIVAFLFIFVIISSVATYFVFKGFENSHELKLYKIQSKLVKVQEHTIISLSSLVENRDSDTGEHIRRTSDYVYMIATEAKKAGLFQEILTSDYIEMLKNAAPMHDIGKIVIPDAVLKKPGKLTNDEFEQIKRHAIEGGKIIKDILGPVQSPEFVKVSTEIAVSHHEKWNGQGYPYGLMGNAIPLSARIMALADVFDALTTPRCYKEPFSFEDAIKIIEEARGTQFDPQLTDVFLDNQNKLRNILNMYFGTEE